jgi:hypothetical protein
VLDGFQSSYQNSAQRAVGIPEDVLKDAIATSGEERRVFRCVEGRTPPNSYCFSTTRGYWFHAAKTYPGAHHGNTNLAKQRKME